MDHLDLYKEETYRFVDSLLDEYLGGNVSYEEFLALIRKYFGRTLALMVKKNFKKA